jgi:hypothetical protein
VAGGQAGEEDRSEDRDPQRACQLLHRVQDAGGGADLVHRYPGEDDVEQLAEHEPGAESADE